MSNTDSARDAEETIPRRLTIKCMDAYAAHVAKHKAPSVDKATQPFRICMKNLEYVSSEEGFNIHSVIE